MIDKWLHDDECTGCGACVNVCGSGAISLIENEKGVLVPRITNECSECGACKVVCLKRKDYRKNDIRHAKFGCSKDSENRFKSTSGGLFYEIGRTLISKGYSICGATYSENNLVIHDFANNLNELKNLRQSKYVQSDIRSIYSIIKKKLNEGEKIAFCGTPCQVAGLYAVLNGDKEGLITIDFVCRGVNATKAYRSWLTELEDKKKQKIRRIWFKYKKYGWRSSPYCTRVDFGNFSLIFDKKNNLYMKAYLQYNLLTRPSCGQCEFKGVRRVSDITLGDYWGLPTNEDDNKGTSLVLVNTDKGHFVINELSDVTILKDISIEKVNEGNICFDGSVNISPLQGRFMKDLDLMHFSKAIKVFIIRRKITNLFGKAKHLLRKEEYYN